jgi:hypothetical protein
MDAFLRQAARAEQLTRDDSPAGDLLRFHAALAHASMRSTPGSRPLQDASRVAWRMTYRS